MPIVMRLDVMLAKWKMPLHELSKRIGISVTNLSLLKNRPRALKLKTLAKICIVLDCQPGDILEYEYDEMDLPIKEAEKTSTNSDIRLQSTCID